jgi:phosphatidylserine decarboxylase
VDGVVSERGLAESARLIQAKGIDYGMAALLADEPLAQRFTGGAWATIYLSPRDYHRIHFPLGGSVTGWRYVPGVLWPVNPAAVRGVPGLFAANERLVTVLDTPLGACAVVAVGATIVGRVRAYYDPAVPLTNRPRGQPSRRDYEAPLPVEKGGQLGAFEMGSTVIVLFEPGRATLLPAVAPGVRLRVGEPIAVAPALDRAP